MTLRLAGLFADAKILWQRERTLVLPVAGMFFLLPSLGLLLLLAQGAPQIESLSDQAALLAFYRKFVEANVVPLMLAYLAVDYGIFALFNLYLRGGGQTLGQVLGETLRRLFPFLAIEVAVSLGFQLGFSLFIAPGLFLFARTWLVAPAYAARPGAGLIEAFKQGWLRSGGMTWLLFLLVAAMVFAGGIGAMAVASIVTGLIATALGGGVVPEFLGYLLLSAIGAVVWTALVILRVAAYRATEPSRGM
ncbi:hypothetical protein S2M10_08460 [Sphingomonas sp. S2M10]|uniref:hypothetical protein n=1 Tax=Sphingomonas sp. S2M10 TaxID=2705010 RepID=UPI00145789CF|nr:hypothetical protein [Sphingomonas sp. S2M10]NLS25871.1 hypothetical protein [Sphingomonas sp. S2M10]